MSMPRYRIVLHLWDVKTNRRWTQRGTGDTTVRATVAKLVAARESGHMTPELHQWTILDTARDDRLVKTVIARTALQLGEAQGLFASDAAP